uniref:protein transport protein SEC16B homolog n=1 Tax=Erigeron canadensis TaxID=72917 RepID=UPI001CB987F6|nr:protein transport protein SEC16B homolog [Erigeron canadensis]
MEDTTDEDFFDKLVDDVDVDVPESSNVVNHSIEAKPNLVKELGKVGVGGEEKEGNKGSNTVDDLIDDRVGTGKLLVSGDVFAFENVNRESTAGWEHGTASCSGVKEVQWSAFNAEPLDNSGNVFGSDSDFFTEFDGNLVDPAGEADNFVNSVVNLVSNSSHGGSVIDYSHQFQEGQGYTTSMRQGTDGQDVDSSQYWENPYPGWNSWKYDANTGQWYHDDGYNAASNAQMVDNSICASDWAVSNVNTEVTYSQQTGPSFVGEKLTNEGLMSWNPNSQMSHTNNSSSNWCQISQGNSNVYPPHFYFDPKYPGWYYDLNIQEWRSLDTYNSQLTHHNSLTASNSYYGNEQLDKWSGSDYNWNGISKQGCQPDTLKQLQSYSTNFHGDNNINQEQSYDYAGTVAYQSSQVRTMRRSSVGQPAHALVTFGFGGKLIVMTETSALIKPSYGGQDSSSGLISIFNLAEIVTGVGDASSSRTGLHNYFHTLCHQSFPGSLANGNVGKELNKWLDERITHPTDTDYKQDQVLRLLLSLLKIALQHYGKLRSPFGTDTTSKENDAPDVAVAKLFASAKRNSAAYGDYGGFANCLQYLPSERQIRETAAEVQTLLVSGRKMEALHCAQEGQIWGIALVLAAQLGDQFYADTVSKMARCQLVAGSPLRTLCLLIAGQPADVFLTDSVANDATAAAVNMFQQPAQAQLGANAMLDDWEENLAIITANRTRDDELVLIHLGDCLWKETSNILAAHICYLVAEANFEPYSDSARLCLIGADHMKYPRTYASPEAIQRTEVYEYSKLLGNSQFTLLPFQPYKLIYASMLAEVGKLSDSLKYCQLILRSLKTGRSPEVETWRHLVTSLEDRIKTHQQGGFSTNLAPKLVGKILNLFDTNRNLFDTNRNNRPPLAPSNSASVAQNDHYHQTTPPRVSTSQSTMAMSSLVPSASMEPISQKSAEGNSRRIMHNRSVSEPDFGRSPRQNQVDSTKENPPDSQSKVSTSRFRRFGFGSQLFQKTVGLVLKPRQDKQAKLGETNKFYYDDKLKRWVEEGVDPQAEEASLPPPPTMATFQNGTPDHGSKGDAKSEGTLNNGVAEFSSSKSSGIPPIPATSNQFSARGRMGVRARYVDTFNQGGGNPTKLFQSASATSVKPIAKSNPKFFVPMAVTSAEQPADTLRENIQQQTTTADDNYSPTSVHNPFQPPSYQSSMQRFASMNDISKGGVPSFTSASSSPHSRRTASWGGSTDECFSVSSSGMKPRGGTLGMPQNSFIPSEPAVDQTTNGDGFCDDLHEVEF